MAQNGSGRLDSVPFRMADPERVPVQRYYDEEFYELECERVWPHVWQMACRLEQIPNVGDWIEYSNVGRSVIVVRTKEGVRAFHNACRHRGVALVHEGDHGNCAAKGFICPFHGWRWSADGENSFVYGEHLFSERQLDRADLALRPCRVELWGGCAFINFDDDAPSVRESFGPVADRLEAHGLCDLRAEWWYATELPANWKIAMEAFMEGYHVMMTHPQLHSARSPASTNTRYVATERLGGIGREDRIQNQDRGHHDPRGDQDARSENMELLSEGMAGMCHAKEVEIARSLLDADLPEDPAEAVPIWYGMVQAEISKQLRARGEPVPDLNAVAISDPVHAVEFLFPHYFLLPFFSSMSSYRIRPLGPERCLFEIWSLTMFPEGQEPEPPMQPTVLPYDSKEFPPIPQQDYSNIPEQQRGLHAKGFEFMRLSKQVEGLIANYQRLIDGYIAGRPAGELASASQKLGGNFDGQILDIGF